MQGSKDSLTPRSMAPAGCSVGRTAVGGPHPSLHDAGAHGSPSAQLGHLRRKLQHEARLYLQLEQRKLLQEECSRLQEDRFVKKTIEEYTMPQSSHNQRIRHFDLVAQKMQQVQATNQKEMTDRWAAFKEHLRREEQRMREFWRAQHQNRATRKHSKQNSQKTFLERSMQRSRELSQNRNKIANRHNQHSNSSHSHLRTSIYTKKSKGESYDNQHSQRLHKAKIQGQRQIIGKYLKKISKIQSRTILKEISKQEKFRQFREKPLRILTSVREQRYESKRRQLEEQSALKTQTHEQNILSQSRIRDSLINQKSTSNSLHATAVLSRKQLLHKSYMDKKIEEVQSTLSRATGKAEQHDRMNSLRKRHITINKDKEVSDFNFKMNKLAARIHEMRILNAEKQLPEGASRQALKIAEELIGEDKENVGFFLAKSKKSTAMDFLEKKVHKLKLPTP